MPGPGPQGAAAQLGAPPRGAPRGPGRLVRPVARLRRRERRRLDPRPRHVPLDRRARAGGAGEPRLPGHHAVARQLRPARHPRARSAPSSSRPSSSASRSRASSTRSSACGCSTRFRARFPRLGRLARPAFELCFRRSQICLGHNQFVRLDVMQSLGGFPTSGATEDSTLGYALGARGILIQAMPMVELTDLPETPDKMIRQNARWYLGVLDDIPFLRRVVARARRRRSTWPSWSATSATRSSSGRSPRSSTRRRATSAGGSPTCTAAATRGSSTWRRARRRSRWS